MKLKTIKHVLMCRPLYFSELPYQINPWMQTGKLDQQKALKQWETLVAVYKKLGITVSVIDQVTGQPDMVFTTDEGFVFADKKVLLSRFRYQERQGETPHYKQWFQHHGYQIHELPDELYIEGNGTMTFWNDKIFVCVGYRTDTNTCRYLQKRFPNKEVIELHAESPNFYHLDIGFLPIDHETIFYYPRAYSQKNREQLKKIVPNLISFSKKEMEGFCANSIVTGNTVIHQTGNPTFTKKLKKIDYNSIEVDLSEFKKSGGGIHCLTNILA